MSIPHLLWFWNTWTGQFEAIELTDIAENGTKLRSGALTPDMYCTRCGVPRAVGCQHKEDHLPRYVTAPPQALWWEASPTPLPNPTCYVPDPVKTGLLDVDGRDIFQLPDQAGFLRNPEQK